MITEFETTQAIDYHYALFAGKLEFKVRTTKEVHIIVANKLSALESLATFCIGCDDNKISTIKSSLSESKNFQLNANTKEILNAQEYRGFWVRFGNNILLVGRENENHPFLAWQAPEPVAINYIAFYTPAEQASWILGDDKCWIPTQKAKVPKEALQGGVDKNGTNLYIGRVRHNGHYKIGKVSIKFGRAYIADDGKELRVEKYDVLVTKTAEWKRFNDGMTRKDLLGATNGGQFGNKPILYVASMKVKGRLTPGYFDVIIPFILAFNLRIDDYELFRGRAF